MEKIKAVKVLACEGSNEVVEMVTRTFHTAGGWAGAFAAIKKDAEDYLPGPSYNKVLVLVYLHDNIKEEFLYVTAFVDDPYPAHEWS